MLCLAAACQIGRDPDELLGTWHNAQDRIEFLPDGRLWFRSAQGARAGTFERLAPAEIQVDLGSRWPSGEPRYWRAMVVGSQLGLCELPNGRHCLRFARVGQDVTLPPR